MEILRIPAQDGYPITGKLVMPPGNGPVEKLVIQVSGSGPSTYEERRRLRPKSFNTMRIDSPHIPEAVLRQALSRAGGIDFCVNDFFADTWAQQGMAHFAYNTRGVDVGPKPPLFNKINEDTYPQYLPANSIEDLHSIVQHLKTHERLHQCRVLLVGWSEGTILAPLYAHKYPEGADALFMVGYCNDNLHTIATWQMSGGSSMVNYCRHIPPDADGRISQASYAQHYKNAKVFTRAVPGIKGLLPRLVSRLLGKNLFNALDFNKDGYLCEEDFATLAAGRRQDYFAAIERGDDTWLRKNFPLRLTAAWCRAHFALGANYDLLPQLDLPMYIFHGDCDPNCPVSGAHAIQQRFAELGKANLQVQTFPEHNHSLNLIDSFVLGTTSKGIQALLDAVTAAF